MDLSPGLFASASALCRDRKQGDNRVDEGAGKMTADIAALDAHEQPSEALKAIWKGYSRAEQAKIIESGEIDDMAMSVGYHNGPFCKRCCYTFCVLCNPNGWNEEPCVIDEYRCPSCNHLLSEKDRFCSYCGQAILQEGGEA